MEIYPNPASNRINIKNNKHFTNGKPVKLDLINILGQHFLNVNIPTENKTILILDLPASINIGAYYLSAINSEAKVGILFVHDYFGITVSAKESVEHLGALGYRTIAIDL